MNALMRRFFAMGLTALAGCSSTVDDPSLGGTIAFEPMRPSLGTPTTASLYTGTDAIVLSAQERLPTGLDLQRSVILRTCGPSGGVCHNTKEYPDLHTPANFINAIGAPCNVQSGTPAGIFDRCERPGDRIAIGGRTAAEIGYLEYVPGDLDPKTEAVDASTPGLHLFLADPIADKLDNHDDEAQFIRAFVNDASNVEYLTFFRFRTRWTTVDDGKQLFARISDSLKQQVEGLLTVGLVQGDANHNGIFGARQGTPLALIEPGHPEASYLIGRLRGKVGNDDVPGTRMPLANQPLDVSEMLALYCFIWGVSPGVQPDLASRIDYARCPYSADANSLNLLGTELTWASRIKSLLQFNCGGCHGGTNPAQGLNLVDGDVYTRLLGPAAGKPELKLVDPGKPDTSYLYMKLMGDPAIVGKAMPLDSAGAPRKLDASDIEAVKSWIAAGAVQNQ